MWNWNVVVLLVVAYAPSCWIHFVFVQRLFEFNPKNELNWMFAGMSTCPGHGAYFTTTRVACLKRKGQWMVRYWEVPVAWMVCDGLYHVHTCMILYVSNIKYIYHTNNLVWNKEEHSLNGYIMTIYILTLQTVHFELKESTMTACPF